MMGQSTPSTTAPQVRLCFTVEVTSVEAATAWNKVVWCDGQVHQVKVAVMVVKMPRVKGGRQGPQSFQAAFRALSSSGDDEGSAEEVLPSAGLRAVCLSRHSMPPTLPRRGRVPGCMGGRTRGCVDANPSCSNARASRSRPPNPCRILKLNPEIGNSRCRMTNVAPSLKHLLYS
ncbi:hypothetical protein E2C01_050244 [Portunus trituberculatus]|uniref:Uncharacterized protein n=1 Tax=Portunus trituberculatus TaxID=210409 RepID=A0A5B7G8G7_PORTR|nr:hypothetical protein [Portunus trituberculatus]